MKKILFFILTLIIFAGVFARCNTQKKNEATEPKENIVYPLPETLDINTLDNCTTWVSLEKGDALIVWGDKVFTETSIEGAKTSELMLTKHNKSEG